LSVLFQVLVGDSGKYVNCFLNVSQGLGQALVNMELNLKVPKKV
jgi:hypothetical protein